MMLTRILMPSKHLVDARFLLLRPGAGRRGGSDRDAALAFLLHPVGHGGAFVHFADLVDHAGVKKNALGQRRLAGIDVRGDADVPRPLERELAVRRIRIRRVAGFCSRVAEAMTGKSLPAEMGEGAVGLRHLVSVVALLDRVALAGSGVPQFVRQALRPSACRGGCRRIARSSASRAKPDAPASLPSALDRWRHRRGAILLRDAGGHFPAPCSRLRADRPRPNLRAIYRSRCKRSARRAISCRASSRWK